MEKSLIVLYGKGNEGKTSTLIELIRLLKNVHLKNDFVQIIDYRNVKIGFVSSSDPYGDNLDIFEKEISNLVEEKCDIIICTSRTSGRAKKFLEAIDPIYNKLWLSTILSTSFDVNFFNFMHAKHIENLINQIIDNNNEL